jgi:RNA polymerase sigma-70 factor (ECF subfamily)
MHRNTDEELIAIYQNDTGSRRRKAFDCLYVRYSKPLTRYFYFALRNDLDKAKDFFHDLFVKILESPEKFNADKPFKPWIYKVASNMCLNDYRRDEVFKKYNSFFLQTTTTFGDVKDKNLALSESIGKLSPDQRSLIILRFKIELSIKEIAAIYECPEGTIKSRLFYAIKELAKFYKTSDYEK